MNNLMKSNKGFSLIEITLVMGLTGILSVVLLNLHQRQVELEKRTEINAELSSFHKRILKNFNGKSSCEHTLGNIDPMAIVNDNKSIQTIKNNQGNDLYSVNYQFGSQISKTEKAFKIKSITLDYDHNNLILDPAEPDYKSSASLIVIYEVSPRLASYKGNREKSRTIPLGDIKLKEDGDNYLLRGCVGVDRNFIKVGISDIACNSANKGGMRYNDTSKKIEYCNETAWTNLGGLTCNTANIGFLRYNNAINKMEYCNGIGWNVLSTQTLDQGAIYLWVSSTQTNGNINSGSKRGIAAAHDICQIDAGGITGLPTGLTHRAILGSPNNDPKSYIQASDSRPVQRPADGGQINDNWSNFMSSKTSKIIDTGNQKEYWTGLTSSASPFPGKDCNNWESSLPISQGNTGKSGSSNKLAGSNRTCNASYHLLCVSF